MALPLDTLMVRIEADSRQMRRELQLAERQVGTSNRRMARGFDLVVARARFMAAAIPLAAAVGGGSLVKMAADVEEMQSKSEVVFGSMIDDVRAWSAELAAAANRSRFDLEEMASSVQDTFVPLGFAREQATEMSKALTELAVDVASFNNASDVETMQLFTSALVGNHEAVRRFGVVITEAQIEAELFRMGIKGGTAAASEQEKVMARLNLLYRGTSDAQGDAVRTADSFANQLKGLEGAAKDLGVELGRSLLPAATELVEFLRGAIADLNQLLEFVGILEEPAADKLARTNRELEVLRDTLREMKAEGGTAAEQVAAAVTGGATGTRVERLEEQIRQLEEEKARLEAIVERDSTPLEVTVPARSEDRPLSSKTQEKIADMELEAQQQARLADAYRISEEAGEAMARQIERENQIRAAGLELKSKEGQALDQLLVTQQNNELSTQRMIDSYDEQTRAAERYASALEGSLVNSLEDLASGYGDLRSVAVAALKDILRATIDLIRAQHSSSLTASGSGGFAGLIASGVSAIFGGPSLAGTQGSLSTFAPNGVYGAGSGYVALATGGRFNAGEPMLVGERGPELVVPDVSGRVFNNAETRRAMSSGQVVIQQQISIHPDVSALARQQVLAMLPVINKSAESAVRDARLRDPRFFNGA